VSSGGANGVCDADSGTGGNQCTIREALKEEAAAGGQDTIVVPAGTYAVSQFVGGPLTVTDDARIEGAGAGTTHLHPSGTGLIMEINPGAEAQLWDLTLRDGATPGGEGGAIRNAGDLVINRSVLRDNSARLGGAIWSSGLLRVSDSTLEGNQALSGTSSLAALGGGIYAPSGSLEIVRSSLLDNRARNTAGGPAMGGGVHSSAVATLSDSSVQANHAVTGFSAGRRGGGLLLGGGGTVTRTTLESNTASLGGGIFVPQDEAVRVIASTLLGNQAISWGGGVYAEGNVLLSNSTLTLNFTTAPSSVGGGVYIASPGSLLVLHSTLVDNLSGAGDAIYTDAPGGGFVPAVSMIASIIVGGDQICAKTPSAQAAALLGHNVVGDGSCGAGGPTDRTSTDPMLESLAANGGPTQTHPLKAHSPAIDLVAAGCPPPVTDQRGVPRPQLSACDAGAFERTPTPPEETNPPEEAKPPAETKPPADTEILLELKSKRRQRLKRLAVVVRCPHEACKATAKGMVRAKLRRPGRTTTRLAKAKRFRLRAASAVLAPGEARKLKLKLGIRQQRKLGRLIRAGARARARIRVSAVDAAGNATRRRVAVKLRR
jgi:hypothetical protein